jgi:hypothetical protein
MASEYVVLTLSRTLTSDEDLDDFLTKFEADGWTVDVEHIEEEEDCCEED